MGLKPLREFFDGKAINSGSAAVGAYAFPGTQQVGSFQDLFKYGCLLSCSRFTIHQHAGHWLVPDGSQRQQPSADEANT